MNICARIGYGLVAWVALSVSTHVPAVPLPYADGFDYALGERLGGTTSSNNWSAGNSTGTGSPIITNSAALTYPGLPSLGGHGVLSSGIPTSNRDRGVVVAPDVNSLLYFSNVTSLYISYLLRVDSGPTGNPRLLSAYRDSTGGAGGFTPSGGIFVGTNLLLGIAKQSNTDIAWTQDPLSPGSTNLIVWRYTYVDGATNDELALWVNPPASSFGASESLVPPPTVTTTIGPDDVGINSVHFTLRTAGSFNGGGDYALDELRIGTTWASVVVPEPRVAALIGLGLLALWYLRRTRRG
ncbi:MAG: hypothetical protein RMN51_00895 [Verrucomicrobiota bacterium]|nr:hypothetical protein [Limisphaera sp.]MDW8380656.1 hypothetical protein [Verrucomicrobiota bacterium]